MPQPRTNLSGAYGASFRSPVWNVGIKLLPLSLLFAACTSVVPSIAADTQRPSVVGPQSSMSDPCSAGAQPAQPLVDLSLEAGESPVAMIKGQGSLWVSISGTTIGSVVGIDAQAGTIKSSTSVGWAPSFLVASSGYIWVSETTGDGSHVRDDPRQNRITGLDPTTGASELSFPLNNPGPIAAGELGPWVTQDNSALVAIDPLAHKVGPGVDLAGGAVTFLRSNAATVFATLADPVTSAGTMVLVDRASGSIAQTVGAQEPLGPALLVGNEAWVPERDPAKSTWVIRRIGSDGLTFVAALAPDTDVNSITSSDDGRAWAWTADGCAYEFVLADGTLTGRAALLDAKRGDPRAIAAMAEGAWLLDGKGVTTLWP